MAIVPQFNGGQAIPTAKPNAPVLDRERRPRVDVSEISAALGDTARAFHAAGEAGMRRPVQLDLFDGHFAGIGAMARGAQNLNDALSAIALKKAEIRNYADVTEAETSMHVMAGEFAEWRALNPDPDRWEGEWANRVQSFTKQVQGNKALAPAARDQIQLGLDRFARTESIRVSTEATKETIRRAVAAGEAKYLRAVEGRDLAGANGAIEDLWSRGLIHEDEKERRLIYAKEKIEQEWRSDLLGKIELAVAENNADGLKGLLKLGVDQKILESDEARLIEVEKVRAIEANNLKEKLAYELTGETPGIVLAELQERDGKGGFSKYAELPLVMRQNLIALGETEVNERRGAALDTFNKKIDSGEFRNETEAKKHPSWKDLDDDDKKAVVNRIRTPPKNDPGDYNAMVTEIARYRPESDPTGKQKVGLLRSILGKFDGPEKNELEARLNGRIEAVNAGQAEEPDLTRATNDLYEEVDIAFKEERFGKWHVPAWSALEIDWETQEKLKTGEITNKTLVEDLVLKRNARDAASAAKRQIERLAKSKGYEAAKEFTESLLIRSRDEPDQITGEVGAKLVLPEPFRAGDDAPGPSSALFRDARPELDELKSEIKGE